jgi:hypothetical protein
LAQAPLIAFQVSAEQWLNARQENSLNPHRKNKLLAIIISKTFTKHAPVTQTEQQSLAFSIVSETKNQNHQTFSQKCSPSSQYVHNELRHGLGRKMITKIENQMNKTTSTVTEGLC